MALSGPHYEALRDNVVDAFSEEAFAELVRFQLGLEWAKIVPPAPFPHQIFLFIQSLEETGTTSDLIVAVLTARPHRSSLQETLKTILASLRETATTVRQQVEKVNEGVQKVKEGMSRKEVRTLVQQIEGALLELEKHIQLLRAYKHFHDALHFVQIELRRFSSAVRNVHSDPNAATTLKESVDFLLDQTLHAEGSLNELPSHPASIRKQERDWILRLREAAENGGRVPQERDSMLGRDAAMDIRTIVRQEPPRIDRILRTTAESLELALLSTLFSRVAVTPKLPLHVLAAVRDGQPATERLQRQVQALVSQHSQWQQIDLKAWSADDVLPKSSASDPSDFDASWGGIKRILAPLIDSDPAGQWATALKKASDQVEACRSDGNCARLRLHYDDFRYQVVRRFFAVDANLKSLAGEISEIGSSVKDLLGEL